MNGWTKMRAALVITLTIGQLACSPSPNEQLSSPLPDRQLSTQERGQYLATAGNCMACHTRAGQAKFSGGRAISTPFGEVYSSNLTSDAKTGIGAWTPDEFWQALHHGRSRDGRWLYPAFPYPNYSRITRDDSDALLVYLKSITPVRQKTPEQRLRFPYNTQLALGVWRALYFRPKVYEVDKQHSTRWNQGAYLVEGLGHCAACHTPRGVLGNSLTSQSLAGARLPGSSWDAPPLTPESGRPTADPAATAELLHKGINATAVLSGPMAEVVGQSLQHLPVEDLVAMVDYIQSMSPSKPIKSSGFRVNPKQAKQLRDDGKPLYSKFCSDCHGENGEGQAYRYPALAGNQAVTAASANNAIQAVLFGGFGASTQENPRPYGMPPFAHQLSETEIAAVLSYLRSAWGNQATAISPQAIRQR